MANLIGSKPNQVPTNGSLGTMAFQDKENVQVDKFKSTGINDNATSTKVTVSDSGVDVTGTVTADGLTVDGDTVLDKTRSNIQGEGFLTVQQLGGTTHKWNHRFDSWRNYNFDHYNGSTWATRFQLGSNGDVSFYEDTGTTAKFHWDSSAESLGIGTTATKVLTTGSVLEIESNLDGSELILGNSKGGTVGGEYLGGLIFKNSDGSGTAPHYSGIKAVASDTFGSANLEFYTGRENYENGTESVMRLLGGTAASDNVAVFNSNVGIGGAPSEKLHVSGDDAILRLETTSTTGNAGVEFWDAQGGASLTGYIGYGDSSNLLTIQGNGNGTVFRKGSNTFPSDEAMRIDSSGNLLVGASNYLIGNAGFKIAGSGFARIERTGTSSQVHISFTNGNGDVGGIVTNGSTTSYNTSSDERLKENIQDTTHTVDINDIQVREFDWKADGEHQRYGFIAQELETVYPEAVSTDDSEEQMKAVDYSKLVPLLVKEIQQLKTRIETLENN